MSRDTTQVALIKHPASPQPLVSEITNLSQRIKGHVSYPLQDTHHPVSRHAAGPWGPAGPTQGIQSWRSWRGNGVDGCGRRSELCFPIAPGDSYDFMQPHPTHLGTPKYHPLRGSSSTSPGQKHCSLEVNLAGGEGRYLTEAVEEATLSSLPNPLQELPIGSSDASGVPNSEPDPSLGLPRKRRGGGKAHPPSLYPAGQPLVRGPASLPPSPQPPSPAEPRPDTCPLPPKTRSAPPSPARTVPASPAFPNGALPAGRPASSPGPLSPRPSGPRSPPGTRTSRPAHAGSRSAPTFPGRGRGPAAAGNRRPAPRRAARLASPRRPPHELRSGPARRPGLGRQPARRRSRRGGNRAVPAPPPLPGARSRGPARPPGRCLPTCPRRRRRSPPPAAAAGQTWQGPPPLALPASPRLASPLGARAGGSGEPDRSARRPLPPGSRILSP